MTTNRLKSLFGAILLAASAAASGPAPQTFIESVTTTATAITVEA